MTERDKFFELINEKANVRYEYYLEYYIGVFGPYYVGTNDIKVGESLHAEMKGKERPVVLLESRSYLS